MWKLCNLVWVAMWVMPSVADSRIPYLVCLTTFSTYMRCQYYLVTIWDKFGPTKNMEVSLKKANKQLDQFPLNIGCFCALRCNQETTAYVLPYWFLFSKLYTFRLPEVISEFIFITFVCIIWYTYIKYY